MAEEAGRHEAVAIYLRSVAEEMGLAGRVILVDTRPPEGDERVTVDLDPYGAFATVRVAERIFDLAGPRYAHGPSVSTSTLIVVGLDVKALVKSLRSAPQPGV